MCYKCATLHPREDEAVKQINLRDANQQFSKLVREVEESGETFVVIRNGEPAAQLGPVTKETRKFQRTPEQLAALDALIASARSSTAKSDGTRLTRDELHERD
jgi:antitoxin (DNA-binding transcriptional repressor) of toxin-antitoxin stability system